MGSLRRTVFPVGLAGGVLAGESSGSSGSLALLEEELLEELEEELLEEESSAFLSPG